MVMEYAEHKSLQSYLELEEQLKKYERCKECNQINTDFSLWCQICNSKRFQQNFKNWTSGNDGIDRFIKNIQLLANNWYKLLEWILYDRFYDVEYIAKDGFGTLYKAKWKDGYIRNWNINDFQWNRYGLEFVILKSLNNSQNVTLEFINEVIN